MDVKTRPLPAQALKNPVFSERLVRSHHENNYAGAVKRLNAIRAQLAALDWATAPGFLINGLKREELIAANSAALHELHFDGLGGDGVLAPGPLRVQLERDFGAFEAWQSEFAALAKAMAGGSGWAMLSWSEREARLVNHWAADHTHLLAGAWPLLALDMYEHAYHLDFGARAAAYVDAFMGSIHWASVERLYADAMNATTAGLAIDAHAAFATPDAQVLDVRRAAIFESAEDLARGAQWRDPVRIAAWRDALDPGRPVLVYCVHGHEIGRSVAKSLAVAGFDARFIEGGYQAWKAAGLPLDTPGAQP